MNREQRRRAQGRAAGTRAAAAFADGYACPDCAATKILVEHAPGVLGLVIAHDDTCPWLAGRQSGATPRRNQAEAVEELRMIEGERLDRMHQAAWLAATGGDLRAIDRGLRIMEWRARLYGLDAPRRSRSAPPRWTRRSRR